MVGVLGHTDSKFAADDGSADPAAAAALAAFAAGTGSEHAALTALAGVRLLVPVVAAEVPGRRPAASRSSRRQGQLPRTRRREDQ